MLTAHKSFEDLGTFTLSRGLREIKRAQLAKEEMSRGKGKSNQDLNSGEEPHEEKARLLESESAELAESPQPQEEEEGAFAQPLMSPTSETPGTSAAAISEKAKGKMRERRSVSVDDPSLERIAAAGVGRNGFVPTQEWVSILCMWLTYDR